MIRSIPAENPVLTKHLRSRLRPQHLVPLAIIVAVVCGCVVWAAIAGAGWNDEDYAKGMFRFLVFIQAVILLLVGTYQVNSAVGNARASGMLDFHRISPQRPDVLTVGFLLGGAIREWILFAVTIPFSAALAALAGIGPTAWVLVIVQIAVAGLLYHAAGLVAGLVFSEGRGGAVLIIVLLVVLSMVGAVRPVTYLTIYPAVMAAMGGESFSRAVHGFYGVISSPVLISMLHQIPLLLFLLIAAERKMRHDLTFAYSKPLSVAFFAVIAAIALGDAVRLPGAQMGYDMLNLNVGAPALCYALALAGGLLALAVTPGAGDFVKGLRHARKLGWSRVPLWSDLAVNWAPLLSYGFVFMLTAAAGVFLLSKGEADAQKLLFASATGACTVLYFGAAKQSFDLVFRKHARVYLVLLLFFLWGVPLLLGMLLSFASRNGPEGAIPQAFFAISPLSGIGQIFGQDNYHRGMLNTWIALSSAALLAMCFLALSVLAAHQAKEAAEGTG
jgi:hypothetical protein